MTRKSKSEKRRFYARPLPDEDVGKLLSALKEFQDCSDYYPPAYISSEIVEGVDYLAYEAIYAGGGPDDWKIEIELKPENSNSPLCALHYSRASGFGHRNPDRTVIYGPHLHVYRDGDIAYAIPITEEMGDIYDIFAYFFRKYNIDKTVERRLLV